MTTTKPSRRICTVMRPEVFESLDIYDTTYPTYLPIGKRWRRRWPTQDRVRSTYWVLCEVVSHKQVQNSRRAEVIATIRYSDILLLVDNKAILPPKE